MNKLLASILALSAASPAVAQDYERLLGGRNVPQDAQIRFAECPAGTRQQVPEPGADPICVVDRSGTYAGSGSGGTYSGGSTRYTSSSSYTGGSSGYGGVEYRTNSSGAAPSRHADGAARYREYDDRDASGVRSTSVQAGPNYYNGPRVRQPTSGRSDYAFRYDNYYEGRSSDRDSGYTGGDYRYAGGSEGYRGDYDDRHDGRRHEGGRRMPGHPCVILDPVPTEAEWNARGGPCRLVDIDDRRRHEPPRRYTPPSPPPRYVVREDSYYRRESEYTRTRYAREWYGQDSRNWRETGGGYSGGGHHGASCGCHDHDHHDHHGCGRETRYGSYDGYIFPGVGGRSPIIYNGGGGGRVVVVGGGGGRTYSRAGSGAGAGSNSSASATASTSVNVNTNVGVHTGINISGGGGYGGGGYGGHGGGGYGGHRGGGYSGGGYGGGGYSGGGYGGGGYSGGGGGSY